ncbi:MAG: DNA mismatch repair protein MutS, partial [SAR324 cluster bacterium]|nr:DNA mismatch repair protein MutS [SAR324 cluster bacterium]
MGRISLPVAGIADLVALRESIQPLQTIPEFLKEFDTPLINQIRDDFDILEELKGLLDEQLLEEPSNRLREGGFMAAGVSEELDELRRISQNTKQFLNEMLVREKQRTGIPSLKISFNKVFGYYMEVSNVHKDSVPEDYIRKQTLVNAERYITQELKEFEEKILTAEERIGELEYSLFLELKEQIMLQSQRLQKTASEIAVLDVLAGWADLAEHMNYKRPVLRPMSAERMMDFRASRHPVIEQIDLGEAFVPNDLRLEQSGNRIMLITGPNMAGKSTFMRQVALNVLMAQCGCFVPAEHAEFSMVDRIFTRVGASDNLSLGQSTFMMEMNEV